MPRPIELRASVRRPLSASKAALVKRLSVLALALAACGTSLSHADAQLTYQLTGADGRKEVKQFSIARFFVRIDDPAHADRYLLFQAGKFFPLYAVDTGRGTYSRLTPAVTATLGPASRSEQVAETKRQESATSAGGDAADGEAPEPSPAATEEAPAPETPSAQATAAAEGGDSEAPPEMASAGEATPPVSTSAIRRAPAPPFKASKKMRSVAGMRCRVVHELADGEPVIEHCMANSAHLGVTKREIITLARWFATARGMESDWLGVGTQDEEFVSVESRDLRDGRVLQLTGVSTQPLPAGYLRISRNFILIEPEAQSEPSPSETVAE